MAVVGSCARPSFSALSLPFGLLIVGGTRNSCDDEDDVVQLGASINYVQAGRGISSNADIEVIKLSKKFV